MERQQTAGADTTIPQNFTFVLRLHSLPAEATPEHLKQLLEKNQVAIVSAKVEGDKGEVTFSSR